MVMWMAPLTSSFCQALCPQAHRGRNAPSSGEQKLPHPAAQFQAEELKECLCPPSIKCKGHKPGFGGAETSCRCPLVPLHSWCLALTCLCSCWEAAEPPVPAPKPLASSGLEVWELWASVSASGGSGEGRAALADTYN